MVWHNSAIIEDVLPRAAAMERARRLGLAQDRHLTAESVQDLILAFDPAIDTSPPGRSRAIDHCRASGRLAEGSDNAALVDAMARSRFPLWKVRRQHEIAGLYARDIVRDGPEVWLGDESLEQTAAEGAAIATRLCEPGPFWMTSGTVAPVDRAIPEEALDTAGDRLRGDLDRVVEDRRFVAAIDRAALGRGLFGKAADDG